MEGLNFGLDKIPSDEMTDKLKQGFGNFKLEEVKRDRFFATMVMFKNNGMNYLFAHSEQDNRWLISKLATKGWNGQAEIRSHYLVAQSSKSNTMLIGNLM